MPSPNQAQIVPAMPQRTRAQRADLTPTVHNDQCTSNPLKEPAGSIESSPV